MSFRRNSWGNIKPLIGYGLNSDPINTGLVGKWLMNEGGGNRLIDLTGKNNVTLISPAWQIAPFGVGPNFDGTGTPYGEVASNSSLDTSVGTWCCWFRIDNTATNAIILFRADAAGSSNGITLFAGTTIGLQIKLNNASPAMAVGESISGGTLIAGNTYHVALVFGQAISSNVILYLNGSNVASTTIASAWTFNNQVLRFGKAIDTFWDKLDGAIGVGGVYNRALTPGEVLRLYQEPFAGVAVPRQRRSFGSAAPGVPTFGIPWQLMFGR